MEKSFLRIDENGKFVLEVKYRCECHNTETIHLYEFDEFKDKYYVESVSTDIIENPLIFWNSIIENGGVCYVETGISFTPSKPDNCKTKLSILNVHENKKGQS